MIFYGLLIIFTILIILYMYYKHLGNKKRAEQQLQESYENLKDAWYEFLRLF